MLAKLLDCIGGRGEGECLPVSGGIAMRDVTFPLGSSACGSYAYYVFDTGCVRFLMPKV
jgi:hypothetical protein